MEILRMFDIEHPHLADSIVKDLDEIDHAESSTLETLHSQGRFESMSRSPSPIGLMRFRSSSLYRDRSHSPLPRCGSTGSPLSNPLSITATMIVNKARESAAPRRKSIAVTRPAVAQSDTALKLRRSNSADDFVEVDGFSLKSPYVNGEAKQQGLSSNGSCVNLDPHEANSDSSSPAPGPQATPQTMDDTWALALAAGSDSTNRLRRGSSRVRSESPTRPPYPVLGGGECGEDGHECAPPRSPLSRVSPRPSISRNLSFTRVASAPDTNVRHQSLQLGILKRQVSIIQSSGITAARSSLFTASNFRAIRRSIDLQESDIDAYSADHAQSQTEVEETLPERYFGENSSSHCTQEDRNILMAVPSTRPSLFTRTLSADSILENGQIKKPFLRTASLMQNMKQAALAGGLESHGNSNLPTEVQTTMITNETTSIGQQVMR